MNYHKKYTKCSCEKKYKKDQCKIEQKIYLPLPNLPTQPVGGERIGTINWFAPGSVQCCCSICSTVQPIYSNYCNNTCKYNK